ncbi:MAG: DEAD/DEAH box helicase [Caldilineaceae bacterium]
MRTVGFETPTPIQQRAIPLVLAGQTCSGLARNGYRQNGGLCAAILNRLTQGPLRKSAGADCGPA